jgi:hypothetical protein
MAALPPNPGWRYSLQGRGRRIPAAIPNSRENTNRQVEEVEKGRGFFYYFFNLFDLEVKFLLIFS